MIDKKKITETEFLSQPLTIVRAVVWMLKWRTKELLVVAVIALLSIFIYQNIEYDKKGGLRIRRTIDNININVNKEKAAQ